MIAAQLKKFLKRCGNFLSRGHPKVPRYEVAMNVQEVHFSVSTDAEDDFDTAITQALRAEPVPAHLRAAILNEFPKRGSYPTLSRLRAIARYFTLPLRWPRSAKIGLTAALIALVSLPFWVTRAPTFEEYRDQIVANGWTSERHLTYIDSDLTQIRKWVELHQAPWPNHFPKALGSLKVTGGQVIRAYGQPVTLICFASGVHHTHLFVMNQLRLAGLPGTQFPDFSQCHGWDTASWSCNGQVFILTGVKNLTFVRQFRKEGHWIWNG